MQHLRYGCCQLVNYVSRDWNCWDRSFFWSQKRDRSCGNKPFS